MSKTASSAPLELVDDELPEEALKLHRQGMTSYQIARRLLVSIPEVNSAWDRVLPKVDSGYRSRSICSAVADLDTIVATHMAKVGDPDSASIAIRALCERRPWIGLGGGSDPVQVLQAAGSTERSTAALERSLARPCASRPKPEVGDEAKEQPDDGGDSD